MVTTAPLAQKVTEKGRIKGPIYLYKYLLENTQKQNGECLIVEKRNFSRIVCKMKGSVKIDNLLVVDAKTLNISLSGALFELADHCALKRGDNCQLSLILPDSDISLQFKSEIIHSTGKTVGVKFLPTDAGTIIHLKNLMVGRTSDPERVEREMALLNRIT